MLVHLYEQYGDGFVERLRGMFAFALWDSGRSRLLLARDRYGIKPLYYRDVGGELEFASELRALPRGEIDLDALDAFLAFNSVPGPLTIFRDVRKLQPGHLLTWENGRVETVRYARPAPVAADEVRHDEEAELVEELRARLRDSVRAHLVSDVPVGVLLSGGIDSSALAALAAEELSEPLRTFSIGFEERSFDELADARLVAERYGTDHHELVLRPDAALLLPALADAFDEPFADSSALPTYLVSQLAAQDVKVALSGEGGDELFGGYYTYAADLLAERAGWTAPFLRPVVERLPSSSARASFDYKAKRFVRAAHLPPLERHHGWKEIFSPDARAELTGRSSGFDPVDVLRARFAETEGAELLARLQDVDLGTYLVDDLLVKTDRASMAHSLEARVPFLDPAVTNFSFGLPTPAQGARPQEEGAAAQGRGAADPAGAAAAAQARVLDSRGRLASRRARAVRAGDALRRDVAPPGLLPARDGDEADRRPRRGARGPEPPAVGPAHVHALARAARGANARPARGAAARSARQVKVWVDISAPAHVLVFRPLIALLRERGDEIEVTTRDYAQTLELLEPARDRGRGDRRSTAAAPASARRVTLRGGCAR